MGLGRWLAKCKRRRGGVYAWRTRKHCNPMRREWGYVGETVSFGNRERDHRGTGQHGQRGKPWMDLDARCYRIIRLPWWLCWKWVLRPLETVVIVLLCPRYNVAKNKWNPRRVPLHTQGRQRAARDMGGIGHQATAQLSVIGRRAIQGIGIVTILMGVIMTVIGR